MSTANALLCAVLFYGFLVLLGRATIVLFRYQSTPLETHAISPVIGLAVLTLLTTYLVLLGIPLDTVSKNMALGIAVLATIILKSRAITGVGSNSPLTNREYLTPLVTTVLLVTLPFIFGGYQFAILRGNGTDAFNYVTMADAISRFRLDWILGQTTETLSTYSPSLPLAQDLLTTRWSTAALLAFASRALGIAPIEFEHAFTLTLMVVLFSAFVAALSATGALTKKTVWIPVVFVVGFWGQFTLDIRAFSQICSLPILVVLIGWLLTPDRTSQIFRYGVVLTSVLIAGLFFQYPEIVVAFLPGAGLIFAVRIWMERRKNNPEVKDIWEILAVSFITLLLSAPIIKFVVGFAIEQGRFAVNKSLGWEAAYFEWMKHPIRGLWGGGINLGIDIWVDNIFTIVAILTSLGLTLGLGSRIIMLRLKRQKSELNRPEVYVYILAGTGLFGALFLVSRNNIWAAGKVLSYFSILIPIWMAIYLSKEREGTADSILRRGSSYILGMSIIGWGAMGFTLAGARIIHSINQNEFSGYIAHHGEYRRVNVETIARMPYFNCPTGSSVAVFEPTVWGREFLTHLAEGRGFSAFTPGFTRARNSELDKQYIPETINCVLANRKYFDGISLPPGTHNQSEVVASPPGDRFATLLELQGGYGVEVNQETATQYVWTGQQDVLLTLLAHGSAYVVGLKLCPGVVRGTDDPITVSVELNGQRVSQRVVRTCIDLDVELTGNTETKLQKMRLTSADPRPGPTLLGQDIRDLRLRVEVSKVSLKVAG